AVNGPQIDLSQLAEEIGRKFGFAFGLFNGLAVLEVILVTTLNPLRQALRVEALDAFAQFVNDDVIRQAIVEHEVDHVASRFWEPGDSVRELGRGGVRWMMDGG